MSCIKRIGSSGLPMKPLAWAAGVQLSSAVERLPVSERVREAGITSAGRSVVSLGLRPDRNHFGPRRQRLTASCCRDTRTERGATWRQLVELPSVRLGWRGLLPARALDVRLLS